MVYNKLTVKISPTRSESLCDDRRSYSVPTQNLVIDVAVPGRDYAACKGTLIFATLCSHMMTAGDMHPRDVAREILRQATTHVKYL